MKKIKKLININSYIIKLFTNKKNVNLYRMLIINNKNLMIQFNFALELNVIIDFQLK